MKTKAEIDKDITNARKGNARPVEFSEEVREKVVSDVAERILAFAAREFGEDKVTQEKADVIRDSIKAAFDNAHNEDDTFSICYWLEKEKGFGITDEIYKEIKAAIDNRAKVSEKAQQDWVIQTGVRFPAKQGDTVAFGMVLDGKDTIIKGKINAVVKARAIGYADIATTTGSTTVPVPAECVHQVISNTTPAVKGPPPTFVA